MSDLIVIQFSQKTLSNIKGEPEVTHRRWHGLTCNLTDCSPLLSGYIRIFSVIVLRPFKPFALDLPIPHNYVQVLY